MIRRAKPVCCLSVRLVLQSRAVQSRETIGALQDQIDGLVQSQAQQSDDTFWTIVTGSRARLGSDALPTVQFSASASSQELRLALGLRAQTCGRL